MRRLTAITVAVLLATTAAHARSEGGGGPRATAGAAAGAIAISGAAAGAHAAGGSAGASVSTKEERQAPGVGAPSLAASSEACMGSSSAGASVAGFGLAVGSTWANEECQRRLNSQQLRLLGHNDAALAILCTNAGVADALAAVGKACPAPKTRAEAPSPTPINVARHPGCDGRFVDRNGAFFRETCR